MGTSNARRRTVLLASTALGVAAGLAACGGSDSGNGIGGGSQAASCTGEPPADHSMSSLPHHVTPRPGPGVLYAPRPRAPQLENTGVWEAPPILISGASAYRCGEFLYQDWLFDDHGAAGLPDLSDPQEATAYLFSPKAGSLTYPTDAVFANNAADLLEFRVKPLADATAFRLTLNTLQDAERTAFTIALGGSSEAHDWPHGAGVSSPAEWFLTVHGASAELLRAADGELLSPAPTVAIDMQRRQVEVRVPHAAWNPAAGRIRMAAGIGLWDTEAGTYLQPGLAADESTPGGASVSQAALFNVAFRFDEPMPEFSALSGRTIVDAAALARVEGKFWRERAQADALMVGDVSPFFAEVDFGKLASGVTDDSGVPQTGFMNRIFASRFEFGQGVDYASECGGISAARPCDGAMVGQLQPYSVYIPDKPAPEEGYGLTMLLHALSANLNQYMGSDHARQMGERGAGTIVVTPAGRGPDGFYFDVAEADMFEVWADVARHYPLDPDWTVLSGYSMGGIGTFRLAPRYPDLFARVMPIVAGAGSYEDQLPSLRNVPVMMWIATFDELQSLIDTEPVVTALTDLGYRFDVLRFETWDHLTPATFDNYAIGAGFLGEARVDRDPAHITYVLDPAEDEARVDVIADKAYWLSGLTLREESAGTGVIDVRSEGFGVSEPEPRPVAQSNDILTQGNHEPAPYTRRVLDWTLPEPVAANDRLVIHAENIATVTIHPERARVSCNAELVLDSDGPLEVTLAGCD